MTTCRRPVRIANCSGFLGDRQAAATEMVSGGDIDVLTGDWLAELTMLILARQRAKRPEAGFAAPFVAQMSDVLADCLRRGIRVVANAGGVNPQGCAAAVRAVAEQLGLEVHIAVVLGDDILPRLPELIDAGHVFAHMESGQSLAEAGVAAVSANAYLGAWGIAVALEHGADVVITGRVTDAALITGAAAWWHGWGRQDWDRLAGSVVAGHVIECGAQATGGNFAFFDEVPGLEHPGFPIAEVADDGSSVITKHHGTGGIVTTETVTAQLLYEIGGPRYPNPDVVARFDTIRLNQLGPDRVAIGAVVGEPAPPHVKVCINYLGGYKNSVTFALTGLDIEAKAKLAERTLWRAFPGGKDYFDEAEAQLVKGDGDGHGLLQVTVVDADRVKVGRAFANKATEMVLASYPGFFMLAPPGDAKEFGVFWPALVDATVINQRVLLDGELVPFQGMAAAAPTTTMMELPGSGPSRLRAWGPTVRWPLGRLVGARSGDKGGDANVGVWARNRLAYGWLVEFLTPQRLGELVPETGSHHAVRYIFENINAVNFVVKGLLGRGVAASTRFDTQAKSLGERVRAAVVDVPTKILPM